MTKYFTILIAIFILGTPIDAYAQFKKRSITRAVVVGISDYQDSAIPDLKYAHSDAQSFASFLESTAGGKVPKSNIQLLTNTEATCGQVHQALNWLVEETKKNDRAYIYFSGHGDVESIDEMEQGHLLLHNTSGSIYQLCSVKIEQLREIIKKLTVEKQAQAIVVTDACRAGTLAGESIQGAQATASALYQQFTNEVKIMSCQPNEFSLEGKKWSGGAFTHFLLQGGIGKADLNGDAIVNTGEIGTYLDLNLPASAYPHIQNPVISGDKSKRFSFVDLDQINAIKSSSGDLDTDGISNDVSNSTLASDAFYEALKLGRFLDNENSEPSAVALFEELQADPKMKPMLRGLKGDLISALQDDVQQSIKAYLRSDNSEMAERFDKQGAKYTDYPKYMEEAANLLGKEHYLYRQMIAKKYYFEAVNSRLAGDKSKEQDRYFEAMESIQNALLYEDRAAYIYNELGLILRRLNDDSCEDLYLRAIKLSPTWALPYSNLSYHLIKKQRYEEAKELSFKAIEMETQLAQPYYNLAQIARIEKDLDSALKYQKRGLELRKSSDTYIMVANTLQKLNQLDSALVYATKAYQLDQSDGFSALYLSRLFAFIGNSDKAKEILTKSKETNPNNIEIAIDLGWYHFESGQYQKAMDEYQLAESINGNDEQLQMNLGILHVKLKEYERAKICFLKITDGINPQNYWADYNLACLYSILGQNKEALRYLETCISKGFDDHSSMESESDFQSIRTEVRFMELLEGLKK